MNTHLFNKSCLSILWPLFAVHLAIAAEEEFYPVYIARGNITYTEGKGGKNVAPSNYSFEVAEDANGRWQISIHSTATLRSAPPLTFRVLTAYDGTNIYSLNQSDIIKINPHDPLKLSKIENIKGISVAGIGPGPYPIDEGPVIGTLWLAFMAGNVVDPKNNRTRLPNVTVDDARMNPFAWSCDFIYELAELDNRFTLSSGVFVVNPKYVRKGFSSIQNLMNHQLLLALQISLCWIGSGTCKA
jgi:hypothetical protein